ncbi:Hypothetical predicted protein [Mytilus galloprovincialis]|uniref:Endonuclease/exonuclease/phosphatase domain-containing protein n=1 Tax=Mytilus galloprovincialis TaxID=29158 RepID=A0A8B6FNJ3_MYTGA|nr:Hypothetical predicted protein [Mytilus galloprovincialis]
MNEMKIWFLEQKVRQIELDMHKHDTKIMYMNEKIHNTNNTRKEENHHAPKEARKRTFQSNSSQNHTNNFPDDATDLCTRLDDLIVNMRGPFFRNSHSKEGTAKGSRTNSTPTRKLQKQTHSITDLQLEEIKQAEISESQKTSKGNNIIQQTNVQSATEQISANNTTASDPAPPACPTNTTTTLDTSSNSNPVTSSSPDATSIPTAKSVRQSNKCTISLLTFNVEGYRSNKLYLEKISNRADIIFVQEHWLYKHEKHIIGTEFFGLSMSC